MTSVCYHEAKFTLILVIILCCGFKEPREILNARIQEQNPKRASWIAELFCNGTSFEVPDIPVITWIGGTLRGDINMLLLGFLFQMLQLCQGRIRPILLRLCFESSCSSTIVTVFFSTSPFCFLKISRSFFFPSLLLLYYFMQLLNSSFYAQSWIFYTSWCLLLISLLYCEFNVLDAPMFLSSYCMVVHNFLHA